MNPNSRSNAAQYVKASSMLHGFSHAASANDGTRSSAPRRCFTLAVGRVSVYKSIARVSRMMSAGIMILIV